MLSRIRGKLKMETREFKGSIRYLKSRLTLVEEFEKSIKRINAAIESSEDNELVEMYRVFASDMYHMLDQIEREVEATIIEIAEYLNEKPKVSNGQV
jgi:predicted metallo-beta-lactamase superfamily hydrolase